MNKITPNPQLPRLHALASAFALSVAAMAPSVWATEGYFMHGYGARQTALAGAGVADSNDAMALSLNPAGIVDAPGELQIGASVLSPHRSFTGSGGPGFTPGGEVKSGQNYTFIPNVAYARPLDDRSAFAVAVYGNGVNTNYPEVANPACGEGSGVYCGGRAGVNLTQVFFALGYAHRISDNLSLGLAPMFALQTFKADGLGAFAPFSSDPAHLSNNGLDTSTGFGLRIGAELALSPRFRLGAAYQSRFNMSRFEKYAGLFEGHGAFDIPSNWTLGAAFDVMPDITAMLDYRRIKYTDVPAAADASTKPAPLGSSGGPGFGWKDVGVAELGVEGKADARWTWRAGAAFNGTPIRSENVTLNILAPAVQKQHYTFGLTWRPAQSDGVDFAFMYSPSANVSGIEVTPNGPNPGHRIDLQMHQFEATLGWTRRF